MDKRLKNISLRLSEYSMGKFDKQLPLSPGLDEVDAIINGINMLGEELKTITISRNYFNNIFNSVSDMVFILDTDGKIIDVNKRAESQLRYNKKLLIGKSINELHKGKFSFIESINNKLSRMNSQLTSECNFLVAGGTSIPVRINASYFKDDSKKRLILLTATDIIYQKKVENLIIRAIIDTQEKERQRLAKDLHDTITQQLAGIKLCISTAAGDIKNAKQKAILRKSNEALGEAIQDTRDICFNLMPKTLEEFGLIKSVREFSRHFLHNHKAKFNIVCNKKLPPLSPELTIDLYRIIQEFITNALNHGKATQIDIGFNAYKKVLKLSLKDNGKGFDIQYTTKGMGLQNAQSRVKSHNGEIDIRSEPGKGTSFKIFIPLNF